jgi:hypothetical protein
MRALGASDLLTLWEQGGARHPIDRALLFCGWARPELSPAGIADLPLGVVSESLIRLRAESFGDRIEAYVDCERCRERLELTLEAGHLLASGGAGDARGELDVGGYRFRAPSSRDLAAVAAGRDPEAAARELVDRCCVGRPPAGEAPSVALAEVEDGLDALDPLAAIAFEVACAACGHAWVATFDAGSLLWEEIDARARALLAEVHQLAAAYGWSEGQILALSDRRRAVYLDLVGA